MAADLMESARASKHPIEAWLSRLTSIFVLLACGERILYRLSHLGQVTPAPKVLIFGFWFFALTNVVSPALLGRYPSLSHEYLYMALYGQCILLFSMHDAKLTMQVIRNACLLFLVASAAMILVRPSQVLDLGYHGLIPLMPRYAGLAPHANTLGPMIVVGLLCLWHIPFERVWLNRSAWILGLLSLLLTQSKTSWVSFMAASACIIFYRYRPMLAARFGDPRRPGLAMFFIGTMLAGLVVVGSVLIFADVGGAIDRAFSSKAGAELASFTGRDQIWQVAMEEFRKNPVFGYGLTIWNLAFQISVRIPFAVHAHSQFYHSASSAGIVGLIGLGVYTVILIVATMRTARASGGLSLALFSIVLIRGISEVPLQMTTIGLDTFTHLLLLVVLTAYSLPQARVGHVKSRIAPPEPPVRRDNTGSKPGMPADEYFTAYRKPGY
jgi:exopolysaccharide production protein ExoQ